MKVDPETGVFYFPSGESLGPSTTRNAFLATALGRGSTVLTENEPWCSFRFDVEDDNLSLATYFHGDVLDAIHLMAVGAEYGLSWDDWSEEKERARKRANDRWLGDTGLTPGKRYAWGSVWSDYDPKGGFSSAVVRYGRAG